MMSWLMMSWWSNEIDAWKYPHGSWPITAIVLSSVGRWLVGRCLFWWCRQKLLEILVYMHAESKYQDKLTAFQHLHGLHFWTVQFDVNNLMSWGWNRTTNSVNTVRWIFISALHACHGFVYQIHGGRFYC